MKTCRLCTSTPSTLQPDHTRVSPAQEWSQNPDHRSMRLSRFTVDAPREYRSGIFDAQFVRCYYLFSDPSLFFILHRELIMFRVIYLIWRNCIRKRKGGSEYAHKQEEMYFDSWLSACTFEKRKQVADETNCFGEFRIRHSKSSRRASREEIMKVHRRRVQIGYRALYVFAILFIIRSLF